MRSKFFLLLALAAAVTFLKSPAQTPLTGDGWFGMPFTAPAAGVGGQYLYLAGGYNSIDAGTPPWGSIVESDNLYVGDTAGDIIIEYTDGSTDRVPLVFGYTMWFRAHWLDGGAPFKTDEAEPEMTALLKRTLHLKGGFEGEEQTFLRIKMRDKPISAVKIVDNPDKRGEPVFTGGYIVTGDAKGVLTGGSEVDASDPFFAAHTVDSRKPQPARKDIERLMRRLYTFEDDFRKIPAFSYPTDYPYAKIEFSGDDFARIMTRVYHDNLEDFIENKWEPDGMLKESSKGAPSWRYDGFGTWVPNADSYTSCQYSRNRSRGVFSQLGLLEQMQTSVDYLNRLLMYFPENNLKLLGRQIPGHWTVIPNKPLEYSTFLTVVANWPTRYTKELFGDDFQNFGNAEPDGHGMSMMDVANVWMDGGGDPQWVIDNWTYVNEAVHYIDWAMKNPDLSFNENGLMYGETEGGMMEFTMFNNIPCYLGLRMYTVMAEKAGKTEEAAQWKRLADDMEQTITKEFSNGDKWDTKKFGFFHDPSMPFWADYIGNDVASDAIPQWYRLAVNTYRDDIDRYIGNTYVAPRGIGYDQNFITQTSLLLDKTEDYGRFLANLAKLCYSPRLPKPFVVPEGASYSAEKGMYRRQGDLGNFVQQNETLRTLLLVAGTSKKQGNEVKLMPRLPQGWSVNVEGLKIRGSSAVISYDTSYPKNNKQSLNVRVDNNDGIEKLMFRAGPFTAAQVEVNGTAVATESVGDARWAWITIENPQQGQTYTVNIE